MSRKRRQVLKSADTGRFATLEAEAAHPETVYRQTVSSLPSRLTPEGSAILAHLEARCKERIDEATRNRSNILDLAHWGQGYGTAIYDLRAFLSEPPASGEAAPRADNQAETE